MHEDDTGLYALGDLGSWPPVVVMALPACPPARPVKAWRRDRWAIRSDGVPGSGRGVCGVPARTQGGRGFRARAVLP